MKQHGYTGKRRKRWPIYLAGAVILLLALAFLLQTVIVHREPPFIPDYPRQDLSELLRLPYLSDDHYQTLFSQTGLAKPAIDALRAQGPVGDAQIVSIQEQFWTPYELECRELFTFITMEDHMRNTDGQTVYGPPMPELQNGDVLITFSTHTLGWRHGHAGIVVDAAQGITLEAAVIGSDSQYMDVHHWRDYSNYLVLRLRDITPQLQTDLANYCIDSLHGIPYHITSGFLGSKAPDTEDALFGVQCSYLVWYAFQHFGYDADTDGGPLVTVHDLAASPLFEVVQVYGMDPRNWMEKGDAP
ncbi:MAG: hypothetical protein EOM52_08335 [Clostridia bacterium]|nr:hypothetical protein [Clostridia bacterium]